MPFAGIPYNVKVVQVRAASVANVTLTAPGATLDGVTLATGDRILLKDQTTASQNGVYDFNGSAATATRSQDAGQGQLVDAFSVRVQQGTANLESRWEVSTNDPITVGTTSIAFTRKDWTPAPWENLIGPVSVNYAAAQAAGTWVGSYLATAALTAAAALAPHSIAMFRFDPTDYPVPVGRTLEMRTVHTFLSNTIAPGAVTLVAGLYPITPAGATGVFTSTLGTVVASSTASIGTPGASANTRVVSATFAAPAAATYALAIVHTTAFATGSIGVSKILWQMRYT